MSGWGRGSRSWVIALLLSAITTTALADSAAHAPAHGGVIGSKVASPDNRLVGTIIGAAVGALVGSRIGRELDEGDRGCFTHALEITWPGGRVEWANRETGMSYVLTPDEGRRESSGMCRPFTLEAMGCGGQPEKRTGRACQQSRAVGQRI